ncbi:DNL zinc finger-domain-containing protein [Crepidotus variabilis]|uniref:DNL zinc finger-domain-containing protein n=1 Tax=Crepidotus variabilis TaxID=179855 RepID=A0A9P6E9A2_9AGAR|nr:DNL zinc finger-domain-containing protein [Crepidotus variabilis]
MLPSRLFRNTGISPALRSLVTPHPSLPATLAVQLRFRLGINPATLANARIGVAPFSSSSRRPQDLHILPGPSTPAVEDTEGEKTTTSQTLPGRVEPRLSITFTCTASQCGERSTHEFSKRSYMKGIVIVQCPKCKNRHLIADNLGWFKDNTDNGRLRTVEDLVKAKGEKIRKGKLGFDGDIEYSE